MKLMGLKGLLLTAGIVSGALAMAPSPSLAQQTRLGDRLVLSINNVPYSQRQVESYINVKESLRKTNDGNVRVIDGTNWNDALTVFSEDMIILQEAQRLGSFSTQDQLVDKYHAVVRDKIAQGGELKKSLVRLGVDEPALAKALDDVLRVAAFRRSKDRQESQGTKGAKKVPESGKVQWLDELTLRAIVRPFENARTYHAIGPAP